jgi:threonine dehydrogenase-like Zn-dependent dehydrogenase
MKGFAMTARGQTGWVDKPKPTLSPIDALVRPLAVAPCSSDVHNVEMGALAPGRILGHEGIGEIVEVGSAVRDFQVGDRVIIPAITPNWRSLPAQIGLHQHCDGLMTGNALSHTQDGLMAELALIPDADMNLAHLPAGIDLSAAVMIGDMMTTGFYGAELAEVGFGDTVVVIGIGPVGLMAVAGAKLRGAGRIIAIGSRPVCVEAARFYGATDIVNYKDGDITKQVYDLTNKRGADRCIVAGGDETALGQAVAMVRWGGSIGNVNYFTTPGNLLISNPRWGFGMSNKTIRGGLCPGGRARMEALTAMVRYGRIDLSPMVTHIFHGLPEVETAFALMSRKPADLIKPVVLC